MKPPSPFLAQGGEDRLCLRLLKRIGIRSRCAVEFGAIDGITKSNTAYFRDVLGWRVILFDSDPRGPAIHEVHRVRLTADNINDTFAAYGVPEDLDLLSIDIDGNDLWVWRALTYRPSLVIIEYNPRWTFRRSRTVPYDPARDTWDKTDYYGASALALTRLAREKGYVLAGSTEYNLIFGLKGTVPEMPLREVKMREHLKRRDPLKRPWVGYP